MRNAPSTGHTSCRGGLCVCRQESQALYASEPSPIGTAAVLGISLIQTENVAAIPSSGKPTPSQRDGRHSRRQGAQALDECIEFGIGRCFMAKEPAPEPIVFAIQQP